VLRLQIADDEEIKADVADDSIRYLDSFFRVKLYMSCPANETVKNWIHEELVVCLALLYSKLLGRPMTTSHKILYFPLAREELKLNRGRKLGDLEI
jgi:hypothetical protein